MAIETIYKCDAPGCGEATTDPKGWYEVATFGCDGIWLYAFDPECQRRSQMFCGINHAMSYISSIAPEIHKDTK